MKLSEFLSILFIIINIYQSNQQYLSLTNHTSKHYQIKTNDFFDLIGVEVGCPHSGILKNFVLKKNSKKFWFKYQCYSSESDDIDEGEPIIKGLERVSDELCEDIFTETEFYYIDYPLYHSICPLDFGINYFKFYKKKNGIIRIYTVCFALKSKYSTKIEIKTKKRPDPEEAPSLGSLVGIVVGSQKTEDDENIAYPLRGFRLYVVSTEVDISGYYYGYSVLRNMKKELEFARQTFESLKNNSTQKD